MSNIYDDPLWEVVEYAAQRRKSAVAQADTDRWLEIERAIRDLINQRNPATDWR